jgi:hypothetical protein
MGEGHPLVETQTLLCRAVRTARGWAVSSLDRGWPEDPKDALGAAQGGDTLAEGPWLGSGRKTCEVKCQKELSPAGTWHWEK